VLLRLRSWWNELELDAALADGADPLETDELTFRAQRLVEPKKRTLWARSIRKLVSLAEAPGPRILPGLEPYARQQLRANRFLLIALAERLEGEGPHCLRGLAKVDLMLQDGRSPLNVARRPEELQHELESVLSALNPMSDREPRRHIEP
jgi:hypothetical protein